ncbi:hypothetical protein PENCOP_c004G01580 [Penicillium coprophilum]|uniref:Uncharacterized protein n=1 Tax=Penicillium coprophilum TaxID=36646 RepID=A0A1V6UV59_9EURO|nr:hypothetical protein PENCOP_c004G01580 [Penicillium coprophilum]
MVEHVVRNLRRMTMKPDGEFARSFNPNYYNFNLNLRTNALLVSIDFMDLELDTGIIDSAPNINLIDLDAQIKATCGLFIDLEDRWDAPRRVLPSYVDLIDLWPDNAVSNCNHNSFAQAENANPTGMSSTDLIDLWLDAESIALRQKQAVIGMRPTIDLVDLWSSTQIIPVNMDLVDFTLCTAVMRHTDSDSSGWYTTTEIIDTFDMDSEDVEYLEWFGYVSPHYSFSDPTETSLDEVLTVDSCFLHTLHAIKWTSESGTTSVISFVSGTDQVICP